MFWNFCPNNVVPFMQIFDLGGGTLDLAVLFVPAVNSTGCSGAPLVSVESCC